MKSLGQCLISKEGRPESRILYLQEAIFYLLKHQRVQEAYDLCTSTICDPSMGDGQLSNLLLHLTILCLASNAHGSRLRAKYLNKLDEYLASELYPLKVRIGVHFLKKAVSRLQMKGSRREFDPVISPKAINLQSPEQDRTSLFICPDFAMAAENDRDVGTILSLSSKSTARRLLLNYVNSIFSLNQVVPHQILDIIDFQIILSLISR